MLQNKPCLPAGRRPCRRAAPCGGPVTPLSPQVPARAGVVAAAKKGGGEKKSAQKKGGSKLAGLLKKKQEAEQAPPGGVEEQQGVLRARRDQYCDPEARLLAFCICQSYYRYTKRCVRGASRGRWLTSLGSRHWAAPAVCWRAGC